MRKLVFIILIGLPFYSLAKPKDSSRIFNAIALTSSSNFTIGSTHLPINFFKRLYFGGFIDENEKGKISSVNKIQRSGLEIDVNIGVDLFQNKNKGWYINFQNIITSGAQYHQGLFDLILRGNTEFNENISLGKTAFHFRNHQLFQFGKFNQKIRYGITIGNIIQENNGQFGRNDFINFSNPYEWNIIANPNMYSIPNTNNFIKKNGNSLGINFKISEKIKDLNTLKYNFEIKNLGLILLHNNIEKINFDTSFTYSGLSIEQMLNLNDSSNVFNNILNPKPFSENMFLMTPFEFNANIILNKNKMKYYSGIYYRHNSQYIPKIYFGLNIRNNHKLNIGSILSYGGYNKFQLGINSEYQINNLRVNLILQNFLGLIPSIGKSFGIFLKLSWEIK